METPLGNWIKRKPVLQKRAVAYYRHSAQDRQENSIEIQQDQVRKFATDNGLEIIREFADKGKTGLCVEGRDAFNEMLHEYVEGEKEEFSFVLVLDVSRWGRFQETDLSAYYTGICLNHGKQVVYTTIGFPKENDLLHGLHLSIERYRAAYYSRELSGKVWKGCAKIASSGYWAGGSAPYGTHRLLLDEGRHPVRILKLGEHKAIHNQRVTLTHGEDSEVETVRNIFNSFVTEHKEQDEIADALNSVGIPSPGGVQWSKGSVDSILRDEIYAGAMVWNKTSQKMHSKSQKNPTSEWIRAETAFDPIVPREIFAMAQRILREREEARLLMYSEDGMLAKLKSLYERYGMFNAKLIHGSNDMASSATYAARFHSLDRAYQQIFKEIIEQKRAQIIATLQAEKIALEPFEDFIIVDNYFSVYIQPIVPIPNGYEAHWVFHPEQRGEVDLTIGVPLSFPDKCDVLGYLALPRLLAGQNLRIHSLRSDEAALYAYPLLTLIQHLRK